MKKTIFFFFNLNIYILSVSTEKYSIILYN